MGEHQYDALLPEVGAEAVDKEIAFLREMRDTFQALGERELSLDERLDRQLVLHSIRKELFMQEDLRRWRLGRDLAMDIGDAIFSLYVRDFAPLSQRVETMITRLRAAPMYLFSGRTLYQNVPPLWGRVFLESAERVPDLLDAIDKGITGHVPDFLRNDFHKAGEELKKALAQHITWFKNAIMPNAQGDWAMGTGSFQSYMALRNLGISLPDMLELGELKLREAKTRLTQLTNALTGGKVVKEAQHRIKSKTPKTFEHVLDAYTDAVARSRAFIEMTRFATLPDDESLEVMETPSYMTHLIPFAAYINPERGADRQKGIYLVTRPPRGESLERHCYADISNTSIHEGYPGHHLQLCGQNRHSSRIRSLADSIETIEGWAHYCEEEAKHQGFENTEENHFTQTLDEMMRACRVLIDIHIQQKTWTYDQAFEFLRTTTDMDPDGVTAEMNRYTQTPGYPLSYLVGKHTLGQIKSSLKKTFGSDFTDRGFHDLVIYEGGIPAFLAREYYPEMMKEAFRQQQA
jgi:uncharacterized protein (DUF885 family)